jgi:hypothetical protein
MSKGADALPRAQMQTLEHLLDLIERLYQETDGFADAFDDGQPWYNRGYANGMIAVLKSLGYGAFVDARLRADDPELPAGHEIMAWGKAYQHGFEVGARDVGDVIGPIAAQPSPTTERGDSS